MTGHSDAPSSNRRCQSPSARGTCHPCVAERTCLLAPEATAIAEGSCHCLPDLSMTAMFACASGVRLLYSLVTLADLFRVGEQMCFSGSIRVVGSLVTPLDLVESPLATSRSADFGVPWTLDPSHLSWRSRHAGPPFLLSTPANPASAERHFNLA